MYLDRGQNAVHSLTDTIVSQQALAHWRNGGVASSAFAASAADKIVSHLITIDKDALDIGDGEWYVFLISKTNQSWWKVEEDTNKREEHMRAHAHYTPAHTWCSW